jgi:membrane-bound lytic murein transglycosylase D
VAAKQLKHLFNKYNDINYVVLAYLTSPTFLNKAINRANNASIDSVLFEMGGEYKEWLKAFHALAHIDSLVSNDYGVNLNKKNKESTYELSLIKPILFEAIKDKITFNFDVFNALNPQNRKQELPGNYPLKFDSSNYFNITENLDSIYFYQDSVLLNPFFKEAMLLKEMLIYEVRSGDYLGKIAALYTVTVAELQSWNDLSSSRIDVGQELIIYSPDIDTLNYLFYKVKKGDTLSSIAAQFPGITADSIKAINPNNSINPGQLLKIKKK